MEMKMMLGAIIAMIVLTPAIGAGADIRGVRLGFEENPATSMTVVWNTPGNATTTVQYGTTESYGSEATGTAWQSEGDLGWIHEVRLTGLAPGTTYHYRVGGPEGWSAGSTLRTAPASVCDRFTFSVAGDSRSNFDDVGSASVHPAVLDAALNSGTSFIMNTGDLVKNGDRSKEWSGFVDSVAAVASRVPYLAIIGNHDDDDEEGDRALYNQVLALPRNSSNNVEDFYSFVYGNAFIAVISPHTFSADGYRLQREWLEAELAGSTAVWKFLMVHPPFHTCAAFGHEPDEAKIAQYFMESIDRHHVDVVVTGHNHLFELFKPHKAGQPVDDFAQGTVHITAGGGGAFLNPVNPICDNRLDARSAYSVVNFTIDRNILTINYIEIDVLGRARPPVQKLQIVKAEMPECRAADGDADPPPPDGDTPADGDNDADDDSSEVSDRPETADQPDGDPDPDGDTILDGDAEPDQDDLPVINHPPRIALSETAMQAKVGQEVRITMQVYDEDGDPVTVGIVDPPANATFDAAALLFRFTPAASQLGLVRVVFSASDGKEVITQTARITVVDKGTSPGGCAASDPESALAAVILGCLLAALRRRGACC